MDPLTLTLTVLGLIVAGLGSWYAYLSYRRTQEVAVASEGAEKETAQTDSLPSSMNAAETLFVLLLIDQFPIGVWGSSLESSPDFYGHGEDPGSITISTYSSFAITAITGSRTAEAIQLYRRYLLSRRSSRGAFGMLRAPGTSKYPELEILEHSRHTATALQFFLFYDGLKHYCVADGLQYLLSEGTRTPSGAWVDHGQSTDERADPVTAAYIVGTLEQAYDALSKTDMRQGRYVVTSASLDEAIRLGLRYIFTTRFRTRDGLFCYRYSTPSEETRVLENTYQYTTDVLSSVMKSCRRLAYKVDEADAMLDHLLGVAARYGGGLPRSPQSNVPDLDASANLIAACWAAGRSEAKLAELLVQVLSLCSEPRVVEESGAGGWSATLLAAAEPYGSPVRLSSATAQRLEALAWNLTVADPQSVPIPPMTGVHQEYVRQLLVRRRGVQPK